MPSRWSFHRSKSNSGDLPSLRQNIEHRLVVILFGTALVLSLGVSLFIYQTEAQSWRDRQNEAASSAAKTVDLFLKVVRDYMTVVSQLDSAYLKAHPETFRKLLEQAPALLEIIRLDPTGQILVSAHRDRPILSNLFTIPQSNWFQQARAGKYYIGDVQLSANYEPYLLIAVPAQDGGVIASRLRMNVLWEIIAEIRFGNTGQAYIVNDQGEMVAFQDPEPILNRTSIAGQKEFATIQQAAGNRWHGTYTNFEGKAVTGSSAAVPHTNWIVITEIARYEAFRVSRLASFTLGSIIITAGIIMILLARRLMQTAIFQPVETLRDGARKIGNGNLDHRIEIFQLDEIGQVADAFNEMASRLSDREIALKQARDEAMLASQFKSRLLANVGHDLRTPINSILGYAEIMREGVYGSLDDRQQKAAGRIVSNARRLLNLINSILDQAQIEAGKLVLRPDVYDPREILTTVRETMEIPAQTKGIDLITNCAPDLPAVLIGDQQRTQQMVLNLVENALKFTTTGSVSVFIYKREPACWAIDIHDTGAGIPKEAQELIFEPFRQVDGSTTRGKKGIGLGLSIVKQLALLMEGDVLVNSRPGEGSTFTIQLPLKMIEESQ